MSTATFEDVAARAKSSSLAPSAGRLLQRKCACGGSPGISGECEACKQKRLQRKLSIGASNDPLEQEADRVADQVMAMSPNRGVSSAPPSIQRFTGNTAGEAGAAPPSVDRVLASPGRPLDPALQQDMGQRFGYDFSNVRVHTGAEAEQSAQDVNAHAYTVGNNIGFGTGKFAPGSDDGRRLIAHELAHVVQQGAASSNVVRRVIDENAHRRQRRGGGRNRGRDQALDSTHCRASNRFQAPRIRNYMDVPFTVPPGQTARVDFNLHWNMQNDVTPFNLRVDHDRTQLMPLDGHVSVGAGPHTLRISVGSVSDSQGGTELSGSATVCILGPHRTPNAPHPHR